MSCDKLCGDGVGVRARRRCPPPESTMESGVLVPKCTATSCGQGTHQESTLATPSAVLRYLLSSVLSCVLKLFKCRLAKKRDLGACKQEAAVLPLNTSISAASQPSTGLQSPAATPRGPRTCLTDTSPPSPGPLLGPSVPHSLAETHVGLLGAHPAGR